MNDLFEAAREVCAFMADRRWKFCLIGGLAVQRWGEPRTTLDSDFTLLSDWGEEEVYSSALLERFKARISDAHNFALQNRVLLLTASNGVAIDISLGALPFEVEMIRRAVKVEFAPELILPCCTAEDLFIMKTFAGRARDWLDAESITVRQSRLDKNYIAEQLNDLCELKESPETFERAMRLLEGKS